MIRQMPDWRPVAFTPTVPEIGDDPGYDDDPGDETVTEEDAK
jgi:hypothetical protein